MPLIMAQSGENSFIRSVGGREESRRFLAGLGFVPGAEVRIISKNGTGMIVNVKGARIAVSTEMAMKINI